MWVHIEKELYIEKKKKRMDRGEKFQKILSLN